jgi:diacylglycerol kinase (ATP)
MKYVVIVNPCAGRGRAQKEIPIIHEVMKASGEAFEIWETTCAGHAVELAKKAAKLGADVVVAVGGDGTVFEVVNGIVHTDVILGIIPTGTGNDLARSLHIPKDITLAAQQILSGTPKKIDLGLANGKYFINVASIGIDAEIAAWTKQTKKFLTGSSAYVVSMIKNIITYKPIHMKFTIDGQCFEQETLLAAICNGRYYGGGVLIAPNAMLDDGLFEICIIERLTKWRTLLLFPTVFFGKHIKFKEVKIYKGHEITVEFAGENKLNLDGDLFEVSSSVLFHVEHQTVKIIN